MEKGHMQALVEADVTRNVVGKQRFLVESVWDVEHLRGGQLLSLTRDFNTVTNEGLDHLLDTVFHNDTAISPWYVLLFNTDTTPSTATTYAVPVFTESTDYDEAVRQEYEEAAASSQSITNSANKATFTMSATTTIYGAALVGGGSAPTTKANTAGGGTMYCASQFASSKAVEDDDVLRVTISITAANS